MSLETLTQLAEDWRKLGSDKLVARLGLLKLQLVRLETPAPEELNDKAEVILRVAELERRWEGWSRRESRVAMTPVDKPLDDKLGAPLDGEWVSPDDDKTSKRLVCQGTWRLITLAEVENGGEPMLAEEAQLLGLDGATLKYRVYWGIAAGEKPALRRLAARFIGYGGAR